jgi:glutathione peroxidase
MNKGWLNRFHYIYSGSSMKTCKILVFAFIASTFITAPFMHELSAQESFYDFVVEDIHGSAFDLAVLKGKKVLVVNTASGCALTPQYEKLEKLYSLYGGEDFVILAFPSNDFGNQEPGSNSEIAGFCKTEYEISFPVMAKVAIKGENKHPLYKWLTEAAKNGVEDSRVSWNFQKYMISEEGELLGHLAPWKKPDCRKITSWLKNSP